MRTGVRALFFLLAGVLPVACRPETAPEELAVTPSVIQADAALDSYRVEVASNTRWTLSAEEEWVIPDRTSGHDDATVTLRVQENRYTAPRTAVLLFRTGGGIEAAVTLNQAGKAGGEDIPDEPVIRVGSYNLRMSTLDKTGENAWAVRKDRLKQSVLDAAFDIFGLQEVSSEAQAWLSAEFSGQYGFKFFSPYAQNGSGDRAQGIGYRKSAFTLSDWHFFWATDTPDVMSANDTGSSGTYKRGGCSAILTHKATGIKVFLMNNHGCLDGESNRRAAHVYPEMEKRYNPDGLPSFFVGDMNAGSSSDEGSVYMTYASYWKDSFSVLDVSRRNGCTGTYNAYSYPSGKSRIDYVFFRGDRVAPQSYTCSNRLYGGLYASDHFPLWAEMKIKK